MMKLLAIFFSVAASTVRGAQFLGVQKKQPCLLQKQTPVVGSGNPIPSGDSYGPWISKNFSKEAIKNTPCAQDGKSSIFEDSANTKKKGSMVPAGAPGPAPAPSMLLQKKQPCLLQKQTPVVGSGSPIPSGDSYGPWTSKNFSKEAIKNTPCAQDGKSSIFEDSGNTKKRGLV